MTADESLAHLRGRLALTGQRVSRAVAERAAREPGRIADPYRGLYIDDDLANALLTSAPRGPLPGDPAERARLAAVEEAADRAERAGARIRLRSLAGEFGLTALDTDILLTALIPDLDARFERLYGYLHDDVAARRATIGLALELNGRDPADGAARSRFSGTAPLRAGRLLEVEDTQRPFLTRVLRVPDRITAYLLGDDQPGAELAPFARPSTRPAAEAPGTVRALARRVAALLTAAPCALHLHGNDTAGESALAAMGRPALLVGLPALLTQPRAAALAEEAVREARLTGAGMVVGPVQGDISPEAGRVLTVLMSAASHLPVVFTGPDDWDSRWCAEPPLSVRVPPLTPAERSALWRAELNGQACTVDLPPDAMDAYRLGAEDIRRAVRTAARYAALDGGPVRPAQLRAGVRATAGARLRRLARRVEPAVDWADLVVDDATRQLLRELATRARHRDRVLGEWAMRPGGGRGRAVCALFAGESGTGKTLAAEVIAADLGLDLYVVNLAGVVDKYIGETEKNLQRVFDEADALNAVLLFDEADALFGKRSEVDDAHDRYANIETAYLLQRMEAFDGIAILTTNLAAHIDPAFTRRLDVRITFSAPDQTQRTVLWERCLRPGLPRDPEVDLARLAQDFPMTGGSIHACAVTAAYRAAGENRAVTMADLLDAIRGEFRKLGRLVLEEDFRNRDSRALTASAFRGGTHAGTHGLG